MTCQHDDRYQRVDDNNKIYCVVCRLEREQKKPNKYNAKGVDHSGYHFDSTKEYKRYCDLVLLQKAGAISGLVVHPVYQLEVNGMVVTTYEADFRYMESGEIVVEDVKGMRTDLYKLKRNLMLACKGIEIFET